MELDELLEHLVRALEDLNLPYALTGSIASMAYGEPRTTLDIDAVVDLSQVIVSKLIFYREGGLPKHPRDIASMLRISSDTIDLAVIEDWVEELGLADTWATLLERMEEA